jgi:membrane-associated phospholipid phosphatase
MPKYTRYTLLVFLIFANVGNTFCQIFNAQTDSLVVNQAKVIAGFLPVGFKYAVLPKKHIRPRLNYNITAPLLVTGTGLLFKSSSLYRSQQDWHSRSVRNFTTSADDYLAFAPNVLAYGLDFAGVKAKHSLKDRLAVSTMSNLIMLASVYGLKYTTGVKRPDGSKYSFPSGHTAFAFTGAQMIHHEYGHKSIAYSIGGYTLGATVGFLRMVNNRHWFSDVVVGAGVGMLSTKLSYIWLPKLKKKLAKKSKT